MISSIPVTIARRLPRYVVLVVVAVSMSACVTGRVNKVMSSWVGAHYSQLVMSWGPPQAVYDDGQGGRILFYTSARKWTSPGQVTTTTSGRATMYDSMIWGSAQSYTTFSPPQTHGYTAWRAFAIDKDGRIYNWSWRGL
jgi:hypothetical protein